MKRLTRLAFATLGLVAFAASDLRAQDLSIKVAAATTPPSLHNLPLHVAYERGFFQKQGLKVGEFLQLRGGPLATQAVVSGHADVTATDAEGVMQAATAGHQVRAIAAPGQRLSYYVAVRREITGYQDLRSKPFAVSRPGAISQYLLFPALDRAGVPRDSVQWLSVGGGRERMLALLADRVKGALLHLDYAVQAQQDPNIKFLGTLAEMLPEYPFELLLVRKELIDRNPEAVTRITAAIIEACRYIVGNKSGTLEIFEKYSGNADRKLSEAAYDELLKLRGFGVNGGLTRENVSVAMNMAVENKFLKEPIPLESWVDFRFQDEAVKRLGKVAE